jgi:DNA-binding NarL/FixJ family response regulator
MSTTSGRCVLLAGQHHGLSDGVRGLLETTFDSVFMVSDEASLLEGAHRLRPLFVIVDLALGAGDVHGLIRRLVSCSQQSKIVVLTVHDERGVADAVFGAGAHAVVLKRRIGTDLLTAIDDVLEGRDHVSPGLRRN